MDSTGLLGAGDLEVLRKDFAASPAYRIAQNAVTQVTADDVALNRDIVFDTDHSFSNVLDDWAVTNQKQTRPLLDVRGAQPVPRRRHRQDGPQGASSSPRTTRCSGTRSSAPTTSSRRSSTPRTAPSTTARSPTCSARPISDGGQWNMFVNLVRKHGLVPKQMMPETQSSSSSRPHEQHPRRQAARDGVRAAQRLRAAALRPTTCGAQKEQALGVIYRILCIHLGTPPQTLRLAVDRQGQDVPPRRRDDAAGVRRAVRRAAAGRVRLPRA